MRRRTGFLHPQAARSRASVFFGTILVAAASAGACSQSNSGAPSDGGNGAPDGSNDAPACQTPAGQDNGWGVPGDAGAPSQDATMGGPPGLGGEGGMGMMGAGEGGPPGDGGLPQFDGAVGDGGGSPFGDGGPPVDDAGGQEAPITTSAGIASTYFYRFNQQFSQEPGTVSVMARIGPQQFGTNGRFCETCHLNAGGWTITPSFIAGEFAGMGDPVMQVEPSNAAATANDDLDPLFRTVDGTTSPKADVSTPAARQTAYALLLGKGLIRVGIGIPSGAEFSLASVDDPYGYASASELSLFRRPLPTMNVRFLTDVMWDGRQTTACATLPTDLGNQAADAVKGHMQATVPLPDDAKQLIIDREHIIFFAEETDSQAGRLDADGALGGPALLANQPFYFGMNAYPGPDPKGVPFTSKAFTLYDAWVGLTGSDVQTSARLAIGRGQTLFNTKTFSITNVSGLNDDLGMASVTGTCSTCHNAPNLGNNAEGRRFNTGIADVSRRGADVPLYTLKNNATGETIQTMDPGRALISGAWKDVGRFKVPTLRGAIARAPYFHDGSAATLLDVVNVDNTRFNIGLTDAEKSDLVTFLNAL